MSEDHSRRYSVYGAGLTLEQILVQAQKHNRFNQVQRSTTFPDIEGACRTLTFEHFAEAGKRDDGDYYPLVPRYNTQRYRCWKQECLHFCVTPKAVRSCDVCLLALCVCVHMHMPCEWCTYVHARGHMYKSSLRLFSRGNEG